MEANVLNMRRLAFYHSNLSIYYYVYLLLSSLILALSAKCTIFLLGNVCSSHWKYKCSIKIFTPIPIKTIPPNISTDFPILFPKYFPSCNPIIETINVTNPISKTGVTIDEFKNAKLIPTAKASILVAKDCPINVNIFNSVSFSMPFFRNNPS